MKTHLFGNLRWNNKQTHTHTPHTHTTFRKLVIAIWRKFKSSTLLLFHKFNCQADHKQRLSYLDCMQINSPVSSQTYRRYFVYLLFKMSLTGVLGFRFLSLVGKPPGLLTGWWSHLCVISLVEALLWVVGPAPQGFFSVHTLSANQFITWRKYPTDLYMYYNHSLWY